MRRVKLAEVKDTLSKYLRIAENEEIIITRHGKPVGVLIEFEPKYDRLEYRLEHDPQFLERITLARDSLRVGKGVRLEEIETKLLPQQDQ